MDALNAIVGTLNGWLYGYILIALLLITGFYFTFRTKFIQIRLFPEAIRVVTEKPKEKGTLSSFQALMVSTASRVGTGNIIGGLHRYLLGRLWLRFLDVAHRFDWRSNRLY